MARILILIGAHLCTAPRPQKEAAALAAAGHDVTVSGVWFDDAMVDRDRELVRDAAYELTPALDFRPRGIGGRFRNFRTRLASKRARIAFGETGEVRPDLLGYGVREQLRMVQHKDPDLVIVHHEGGLYLGNLLPGIKRVGVDFEDWFSEDLPPEARQSRPVETLAELERNLATTCVYRTTTSHAMANAMAETWQCDPPAVVTNAFPAEEAARRDGETKDRAKGNPDRVSFHWFSQTIGRGRGLEVLLAALAQCDADAEIHLRGTLPPVSAVWLMQHTPPAWRERFYVHSQVPNGELFSRIAEHDVGLALETNQIRSRDLTITNKLFQYLQAGLPVIATETAGQREVLAAHPDAGLLIPCDDPAALARAMEEMADRARLEPARTAAERAGHRLCHDPQQETICALAEKALAADL